MSGNSSSTGGYLRPINPPLNGDALTDFIIDAVAGITGLDASLVRPRWQAQPGTQPPPGTSWCGVGVLVQRAVDYPYEKHLGDANGGRGQTIMQRQERVEVLASFYGPDAQLNAQTLRDSLYLPGNMLILYSQDLKLFEAGELTQAPDLTNAQYIGRVDLPIVFMRELDLLYAIENIVEAQVDLMSDDGVHATVDVTEE